MHDPLADLQRLAAQERRASRQVTRTRDGFQIQDRSYPPSVLKGILSRMESSVGRLPDNTTGEVIYTVKLRGGSALVFVPNPVTCSWRKPTEVTSMGIPNGVFDKATLLAAAGTETIEEAVQQLFQRTAITGQDGRTISLESIRPKGRDPVPGLIELSMRPSGLAQKVPLVDLKKDGILTDAPVKIGSHTVGTVLVPVALDPVLEDLQGLF